LQNDKNAFTDSKIAGVLLRDNVRQKQPEYGSTVTEYSKEAELKTSIVELAIEIKAGDEQLRSDQAQIHQIEAAIATAKGSPYFLATKKDMKFAFVPYENQAHASNGAAVYSCALGMVFCHQVGTIGHIFKDEERTNNPFPFFKNELRGFLVELDLNEPEAAKDKVLFLGRKPLFL
jgi:hypothetical protein